MARPLRLQFPGGIYHVTARGNDRRPIFEDDDDRARFLIVLASIAARYHVLCHAPEANLSLAMRQLNGVYTQRFNRRHERCGHLLQGRFGAQLVASDAYLWEVCRYIVLNPVRAGRGVPRPPLRDDKPRADAGRQTELQARDVVIQDLTPG